MEQQDLETPTELLMRRCKYHKEMMNNFKEGTERHAHHEGMMKRFFNAASYLEDFDS